MNANPLEQLRNGAAILDPLLSNCGFVFEVTNTGKGSGGSFAVGEYRRGDRRLELHYRWGLGIVLYHIGESNLGHLQYMKLLGVYEESRFASTALDGSLDGFDRLRDDLERHCSDFLSGDGHKFQLLAADCRSGRERA